MKWVLSIFFTLMVFTSPTFGAQFDVEDSLVKLTSDVSAENDPLYGTGLIFKKDNEYFILTSEHVVLPQHPYHQVVYQASILDHKYDLELLSLDWGAGLALLKVKEQQDLSFKVMTYEEILQVRFAVENGQGVLSVGIPAQSENITIDDRGFLLSKESRRKIFLNQSYLYEIKGASTELGMSGGLVFSHDLQPLGILTHRNQVENITYALPMERAATWLIKQFEENFSVQLSRLVERSSSGERFDAIVTGHFVISIDQPEHPVGARLYVNHFANINFTARTYPSPRLDISEVPSQVSQNSGFDPNIQVVMEGDQPRVGLGRGIQSARALERKQNLTKYKILGFRDFGVGNIFQPLRVPQTYIEFFEMLNDHNLTMIAQHSLPPMHDERNDMTDEMNGRERSVPTDYQDFATQLMKAGVRMARTNSYDRRLGYHFAREIDALINILWDERNLNLTRSPYGLNPVDFLSAREIERTMNQRFCSEIFVNENENLGLSNYRTLLNQLHLHVRRFNF